MKSPEELKRFTTRNEGQEFNYSSLEEWDQAPLLIWGDIADVLYPPVQYVTHHREVPSAYPFYDFGVSREGFVPLLFTTSHARLLYQVRKQSDEFMIAPNPERVIVNIDHHDDLQLGYYTDLIKRIVHEGNWGSMGFLSGYWGTMIHASWKYNEHTQEDIRLYGHDIRIAMKKVSLQDPNAASLIAEYLNRKQFVLTDDADGSINSSWNFTQLESRRLEALFQALLPLPGLELVHFTPEPDYCPEEAARAQWELLRANYPLLMREKDRGESSSRIG